MPRLTKDQTYQKLRGAVVAEAVEKGFPATNVAGVVGRAKVSTGTVYVHFKNKDDMLRRVYMDIKGEFHDCVTSARDEADPALLVRRMWFGMFDFVRARPQEFLFLDFGATAKILTPEQQSVADGYAADIDALLRRGIEAGVLARLDPSLLSLLLVAPAMQLARSAVLSGKPITDAIVQQTFDRVWLSIANT